ncbi:PAS domain S-box protein [Chryseolinea sp. T2]|uniref:PAS domain S-box protein n=1 Tax=Chryseolinea sp. T2 TaxID=3129255 RepID=UPI0030787074
MPLSITLSKAEHARAFQSINRKSDGIMNYVLLVYFFFGIFLAFFYDTWFVALTVGGLSLVAYFGCRLLLPESSLSHYVMSVVFALFAAQFIYQMHGMFEMHFMFFVGSALLITYRNWKLILPLFIVTVIHHAWFSWLQYSGNREIYFTQLDYMSLQAFLFHAGLAAVIMGICGFWCYDLGKSVIEDASKTLMLERQVSNVENNMKFAEAITQGDLKTQYDVTDASDELGRSLVKMRDSLRSSLEREEEEKFITVGITKIGDVVREHGHDPVALADAFVATLVKYVGLNQGALFVSEGEASDAHLRLAACYAYNRKKFIDQRVEAGQGLVGQCFLERDAIYLTAVPSNYLKITSGLGEAIPRCVFIVPVKTSDEIAGVIELASFNPLRQCEKDFIIRAAEDIASAILSSRTTQRIKLLLADSEQRTEEMRSQEEEMRQNMEELQATQEEMGRKQLEHEERLKALNSSGIGSAEFSLNGHLLDANESFLKMMGYRLDEIQGKHHRMFVTEGEADTDGYRRFWDDLQSGQVSSGTFKRINRSRETLFVHGSYNIVRDITGRPQKVIGLSLDVTSLMSRQLQA